MKLVEFVRSWLNRYFAHEESLLLVALIAGGLVLVVWLGGALAPVFTALIVAFLLQGVVARLLRWGVPETASVYLAFLIFVGLVAVLLLAVLPLVWQQMVAFVNALPAMLDQVQALARELPDRYPTLLTPAQIDEWLLAAREELILIGQRAVTFSFGQIGSIVGIIIYLVLVPILVFFFLKDREVLVVWFKGMLPDERPLLDQVGSEMNLQIANYMRGKALEILVIGGVTYVVFVALGVNFSALLAILVGFSVLVPFIGAAVVTIPVALVGFVQFGLSWDFGWLMLAYAIIQALDGNVLVPLLFSEAVDLHPVAIIVAVLAFGGIWGFWGVFFAIPLASLVKAVLTAWPRSVAEVEPDPPPADAEAL
jgi:putative permease